MANFATISPGTAQMSEKLLLCHENRRRQLPGHVLLTPFLRDLRFRIFGAHRFQGIIHDCCAAKTVILAHNAELLRHHHVVALARLHVLPPKQKAAVRSMAQVHNLYHRLLYTWTPHRTFLYCIRPRMGKRFVKALHASSGRNAGNDTCFLCII